MKPINLSIKAEVPSKEHLYELLQLLRNFEQTNPSQIHINIFIRGGLTSEQALEIFTAIKPPFPYTVTIGPEESE